MGEEWTFSDYVILAIVIVCGWLQFNGHIGGGGRYMDAMYDLYEDE
jgi:hypothetical protein